MINFNQTCSSHMAIIIEFLKLVKPLRILEFGTGLFSTDVFLKNCDNVTSIETCREWHDLIKMRFCQYSDWKLKLIESPLNYLKKMRFKYGLIFIDTAELLRADLINESFKHADSIIVHDSQLHFMNKVNLPEIFKIIRFTKFPIKYKNFRKDAADQRPWTSLISCNNTVINHFKNENENELYNTYKFPYGINE